MDFLPSELNITKTRKLQIIRKTIKNIGDYDKQYYFFVFDISTPTGVISRYSEARVEPIDDALLQKYGFNTERPQAKDNSIANWVNTLYYNKFIDGEILTLIQFEIEDVNSDGTPEYKTFVSRQ